jgi:hypothetical protein
MKNRALKQLKTTFLLGLMLTLILGCERDLSDEKVEATFSTTGDIFIDSPIGLGTDFYFPYGPDANNPVGAKPTAWQQDTEVSYLGTASMRIDVPNGDDLEGNFAGGILRIDGAGRNLTGYDALTFWAKATQSVTIGELGFGEDFGENKYLTTMFNTDVTTTWKKYIIPIPDPSKLLQERGMFRFSAGGTGPDNLGYTFWVDELKFEKLGTIAQPRPRILNGADLSEDTFTGSTIQIGGLSYTANLANGANQTVSAAPSYFEFNSSEPSVATISQLGEVSVVGEGSTLITATLGNVTAEGSLDLMSGGAFPLAPTPTQPAANVLSIFSNAYTNVVTPNFTPGFGGSTTVANVSTVNGNDIVNYTNNNFTGIMFTGTPIDGSAMQFLHVDIFVQDEATSVEFQIRDIGANQNIETNEFTGAPSGDDVDYRFTASGLTAGAWNPIEIPLAGSLAAQRNNLGAIILADGPNFILDNIYFYTN